MIDLEVGRWRNAPCEHEHALLASILDPVLDVGCGPGRIPSALAEAGRVALGIDPAHAAASEAHGRGASILRRSVFEPLPGEGRWATVLLLDGNVGIGGDPVGLLRRCVELVQAGGEVVAELAAPGSPTVPMTVRVEADTGAGPWFEWAVVGSDAWAELADASGLVPAFVEERGGRWFGRGRRPRAGAGNRLDLSALERAGSASDHAPVVA